jgi:DNA-binding beta-propeller fold protein YncE
LLGFPRTEPLLLRVCSFMTTPLFSIKLENTYRAEDSSEEELSPPSGFCFSSEGHLLLADDFNHRVQIYDSQSNLLHSFGSKGKEPGQFQYPKGIAVDSDGNIYVADSWNHRIQKFDSKGTHLHSFGTCGDAKGELNEPYDILVEPSGNLIVVERYNHRIQFFDPQGVSQGWVGDRGTVLEEQLAELQETPKNLLAPPLFELPTSIAKDSLGNYFITDSGNHRVQKFNPQWQEIMSFGEKGSSPGQFEYPLCVTVAPNDLLYVADLNNERVQVFSPFGQYLFAIDEASSGQSFAAPCLTAIDLKGCLHIGFTFNTQIFKYLIPLVSQNTLSETISTLPNPDPSHVFYQALSLEQEDSNAKALAALEKTLALISNSENSPSNSNLELDVLLQLSHLSKKGTTITDATLDLACNRAEKKLKETRDNSLKSFLSWQGAASKYTEHLLEEQKKILKDPDGTRDFNLDLHIAEQEEKQIYRQSRNETYAHRKSIRQFSHFLFNFIESKPPESQLKLLSEVLFRQIGETLSLAKEYFGQKEKSEESMVRILGESQGEKDKLSAFLSQYHPNGRLMDLQQHLQFELRSHWFNLRALACNTKENISLENFAGKMVGDSSAFEDILKILIGFHEDWLAYPPLEQQFLNILDTLLRIPAFSETTIKTDLTLVDFAPIAYDSENLDSIGALKILTAEGTPLSRENDTLFWGQNEFRFPGYPENKEELAQCALKLMETQATYQKKNQELIQQLEEIIHKRNDLDVQLRQIKVEDKVSPISTNDNIAIVQFQINLIRRMIMSLSINQSLNLHRIILAGAFLALEHSDSENSKSRQFFQVFNDNLSQQNHQVRELAESRKEAIFRVVDLHGQSGELNSKYKISEISESIRIEKDLAQKAIDRDRYEFEYQRNSRIKNLLDKLTEFRDDLSHSEASPKINFREIQILEKSNSVIGQILAPHGIKHNRNGDLLVIDYESHMIFSYSSQGAYQFHFGGWGSAPGNLQYPGGLTVDSKNNIYIIEERSKRVKKFDEKGKYLFQFDPGGSGMLYSPSIDNQDNIWIADTDHNQIRIFDDQGNTLKTLQGEKSNFKEPIGIYCLPNGEYLLGDKSESLLKHFDEQGNLLHEVGKAGLGVDGIYFMAWHPSHGIFGTDYWNSQIVHFNHKLEVERVYWKPGRRAGQLGKVAGLSVFNDQLAVGNFDAGKVQIFDLSS